MVAARGARRPRRGAGLAAVRAGACRPSPRCARTRDDLAALADGRIEELPPRCAEFAAPALAHLERSLFRDRAAACNRSAAPSGSSTGRASAGRSSSSPTRCSSCSARGSRPSRSRSSSRRSSAGGRRSRRCSARSGSRTRSRPGALRRRRRSVTRSLVAAALRVGGRRPARALRLPALAVLRISRAGRRLRRGPVARARRRRPGAGRGGDRASARSPARRAARSSRDAAVAARRASGRCSSRCCAPPTALEAPPTGTQARLDLRSLTAATDGCSTSSPRSRRCGRRARSDDVIAALARLEVRAPARRRGRPGRRARPAAGPHAPASRPSSSSGSRRARCRGAAAARRSSTTTAARELGARLERPDPVSRDRYLFYTACTRATRRLYLVREAATDEGSPREASPFWDEAAARLRCPRTSTRRRAGARSPS